MAERTGPKISSHGLEAQGFRNIAAAYWNYGAGRLVDEAISRGEGKLSKDGAQGSRDLQLTRLAIFEADPAQAKDMIGKAQAAFAKAKTDDAVFTKAEADLKKALELVPASQPGARAQALPRVAPAAPVHAPLAASPLAPRRRRR